MQKETHPGLRPPLRGGDGGGSPPWRGAALAAGWVLSGQRLLHGWEEEIPGNVHHTLGEGLG